MDKSLTFDYDFESTNAGNFKGKDCNAMRQVEINNGKINEKTEAIECGIHKYQDTTGDVEARKKFFKTILVDYCNKNTQITCPEADEFGVVNNAEQICKELDVCDYGMKVGDILTVATEFLGIFNMLLSPIDFDSTVDALKFKKNDRLTKFKKDKKKIDEANADKIKEICKKIKSNSSIEDLKAGKGSAEEKKMLEDAGIITKTPEVKDKLEDKKPVVDLNKAAEAAKEAEAAKAAKAAKETEAAKAKSISGGCRKSHKIKKPSSRRRRSSKR